MGEAKRRDAVGGGDILLGVQTFAPSLASLMGGNRDVATREIYQRMHASPAPLFGERPALAYFMRSEGDDRQLVVGAFCKMCAQLPEQRLIERFSLYLRESLPGSMVLRQQ
jgi:hypothetical protein